MENEYGFPEVDPVLMSCMLPVNWRVAQLVVVMLAVLVVGVVLFKVVVVMVVMEVIVVVVLVVEREGDFF